MVQKRASGRDAGAEIPAMSRQAHGADQQRHGEGARRRLVLDRQNRGARNGRAQRTDGGDQQRRAHRKPERFGHQVQAPDAQCAGQHLLEGQHLAETEARQAAQSERRFVVQSVRDERLLDEHLVAQHRGVPQVLEDRRIDLGILLQPGVAWELKECQERERNG